MNPAVFDNALILTGPTASGKTAVGIEVAERLNAEIISMDSMALYRGMDIGTAKPTSEDRSRVPHHLIDVREPWESATLAWWLDEATRCCVEIEGRGKRVLFVGGTPLYLKALLRGIFQGPPADRELRRRLEGQDSTALHDRLKQVDPSAARRIHTNDKRRLIRALEVFERTGQPISQWQKQFDQPRLRSHPPIWLDLPREELYARIDRRVDRMIEYGLMDEVRRLLMLERPLSKEARQALGYKELIEYMEGGMEWDETVEKIKTRSRNFAKRQLTWFRHLEECHDLAVRADETPSSVAARVMEAWL